MRELSLAQRRVIADFFGNVAVGWFGAGVISPFLATPSSLIEFYARLGWGVFMAIVFLQAALYLVEE